MEELRAEARDAPWRAPLDFDGVDALDVLLSPIYLAVLGATRAPGTGRSHQPNRTLDRLRNWAYQKKVAYRQRTAAQQSAPAGPTDILFWSRDVTHTDIMQPVASAATRLGSTCRLLACQPNIFDTLRRVAKDPVYTLGAWGPLARAARIEGAKRADQFAESSAWELASSPTGSVPPRITTAVRDAVVAYLPLAAESIANARAALDAFRPGVLVVGNDLTTEGRAGCRVAAANSVPTAMFTHGSVNGDPLEAMHCADRILLYGDRQRRTLSQLGIADERMTVCGAPHLDNLPKQTGRTHPQLKEKLSLADGSPWVLVATSGPGNRISAAHHQIMIGHLVELARALPEVPIVVKLHRKDRLDYYRQALVDCSPGRMHVVPADTVGYPASIFDWLQGCRAVLTGASAVAVEALLMDVPAITMDFCDEIHDVGFIDAGATAHVSNGRSLLEEVRDAAHGDGPSAELRARITAYLKDAFCALDGHSSERGAETLRQMFQERHAG